MKFLPVTIHTPVPDPENEGQTILKPQDIELNVDAVHFMFKAPLNPQIQIMVDLPGQVTSLSPVDSAAFEAAGLVEMETVEGGTVWVNPKYIQFYFSPELALYVLIFPEGSRVAVKITSAQLKAKLGLGGGLIT